MEDPNDTKWLQIMQKLDMYATIAGQMMPKHILTTPLNVWRAQNTNLATISWNKNW